MLKITVHWILILLIPAFAGAIELHPPLDGPLALPITKEHAISSSHWRNNSRDLPHFGAIRNRAGRIHAGVDLYPAGGEGSPVYAVSNGTILKDDPFYIRRNGEITYALLIDHGEFVANYGEIIPFRKKGDLLYRGDLLGFVSGTGQLHFEMYAPGTNSWIRAWYGSKPEKLIDPTNILLSIYPKVGVEKSHLAESEHIDRVDIKVLPDIGRQLALPAIDTDQTPQL